MDDEVRNDTAASPDTGVDVQADVETRARAQGWKDREEYDRDPDNWIDAESYLRLAEESAPIRNARLKKMSQELTETRLRLADIDRAQKQFFDFHQKALIAEREKVIRELQAKKKEAVRAADEEEVDRIDAEIAENVRVIHEVPQAQQPRINPEVVAFVKKYQQLFNTNPVIKGAAAGIAGELTRAGVPDEQQIKIIEQELAKAFPKHFRSAGTPDDDADEDEPLTTTRYTSGVPAVESGRSASRGFTGKTKERGYADLTPEAKAQCDQFLKMGWIKKKEDYFGPFVKKNDPEIWAR